jgi:hypothetical protein
LRCGTSKPPVPEQRLINRLHAEKMKRRKDATEAKAERKRKRKAKHDKECKLARAEGKARPATPESSEEEEEASDAEDHALGSDGEAAGASPPPFYLWDDDEGEPVAPEVTRVMAEASAHSSLEGGERVSSPLAAGEETPLPQALVRGDEAAAGEESSVLAASSHQADTRGRPRGSLRGAARRLGPEEVP